MARWRRTLFRGLLALVLLLGATITGLVLVLRHPHPAAGVGGSEADEFGHALEKAVNREAWDRTGAVRWTFTGTDLHHHLWDRQRQLARVRWKDLDVLVNITKQTGRAWRGGAELGGAEADKLVRKAYEYWVNDSFWLNPLAKLFDPGVERQKVTLEDGRPGLLLSYRSGGVTPGDEYLWIPGPDGRAAAWRMWVSVLPIPGVEFQLSDWTRLPTGAELAMRHHGRLLTIKLDEVAGAATLAELEPGPDPFAPLAGR